MLKKQKYIFLALWLGIVGLSYAQNDVKLLEKGKKFIEAKNFPAAVKFLEDAVAANPKNAEANWRLAQAYLQSSPKKRALGFAEKAVSLSTPVPDEMYFTLGQARHIAHDFDGAIEAYKRSDSKRYNRIEVARLVRQCEFGKKYVASPTAARMSNMGNVVNSANSEYLPFITADQMRLFFTSRRPSTTGGERDPDDAMYYEDIYISYNRGGAFDAPRNLPSPINTKQHDACIGIAPDGQTMFIYRGTNGGDIYISELKDNEWSKPVPFENNTPAFESSVCMSADGRKLFFVSDRKGNKDIYMCLRQKNKWGAARILSNKINTYYDEESPNLQADGKTLYFSSKGHSSMGGYDIFKIPMGAGDATGAPENLGSPINTAADDLYFSLSADGKYGYFASEKEEGLGRQDLYVVRMPPPPRPPDVAVLKGTVRDETGKPLEATISVSDNVSKEQVAQFKSNGGSGEYVVALPAGRNYNVTIEQKDRLFYSENVSMPAEGGYTELRREVKLSKPEAGAKIILNNVFFDSGKADLRPESATELQRLVQLMRRLPKLKVEVSGHTDNVGNESINQKLSENRAAAVRNFISGQGIEAARLTAKGYGSAKPLGNNATAEGRQQNRRTEFVITGM